MFLITLTGGGIYLFFEHQVFERLIDDLYVLNSHIFYNDICQNIEINGVEKMDLNKIKESVKSFCDRQNKNNLKILFDEIKSDIWVNELTIKRILPNTLQINVKEYLPFAILNENGTQRLVDDTGYYVEVNPNYFKSLDNLIKISGEDSKRHVQSLFNLFSSNQFLFQRVKQATRIGKRRWNFELDNGILVKMPEEGLVNAWLKLESIISVEGAELNLKTIDLRNEGKIFLEWKE
jgi:cell division protein FtsQ